MHGLSESDELDYWREQSKHWQAKCEAARLTGYVCIACGESMTRNEDFEEYQHADCGGLVVNVNEAIRLMKKANAQREEALNAREEDCRRLSMTHIRRDHLEGLKAGHKRLAEERDTARFDLASLQKLFVATAHALANAEQAGALSDEERIALDFARDVIDAHGTHTDSREDALLAVRAIDLLDRLLSRGKER